MCGRLYAGCWMLDTGCWMLDAGCWNTFSGPPSTYETGQDTIVDTIILHKQMFYSGFDRRTLEFVRGEENRAANYRNTELYFNDRNIKQFYNNFRFSLTSFCWYLSTTNPRWDFAPGLGQTTYYCKWLSWVDPPGQWIEVTQDDHLVYYKKGNETWGTPIAQDCETLVGVPKDVSPMPEGITICPNPVENQAEVKITGFEPGETASLYLFDSLGNRVYHSVVNSNSFILQRNGLPGGLYILIITGNSGKFNLTSKIILK